MGKENQQARTAGRLQNVLNLQNINITIGERDTRNLPMGDLAPDLFHSFELKEKIRLSHEVDKIIDDYHLYNAPKASKNATPPPHEIGPGIQNKMLEGHCSENYQKDTLTATRKRSDDTIMRQYKVHDLLNIIDDMT